DFDHPHRKDTGWLGTGVYATTNVETANAYALLKQGDSPNVMPLFAKIVNPYYATQADKNRLRMISARDKSEGRRAADEWTKELKAQGYDGVILEYPASMVGEKSAAREIVVFDPAGVKSAT